MMIGSASIERSSKAEWSFGDFYRSVREE